MSDFGPRLTAVVYKVTLRRVPDSEPLKGCSYYGQSVRVGTASEVASRRWYEERWQGCCRERKVGFLALIYRYGKDAFDWKIVDSVTLCRSRAACWANEQEKKLIAENGGPLQSMTERLHQTLNQNSGGKGNKDPLNDAHSAAAFEEFKLRITAYIEEYGTAQVSLNYKTPDGYCLYDAVKNIRYHRFIHGHPGEKVKREWLNSLPGWSFKVHDDQWKAFESHLSGYVSEHKHADVPTMHVCEDGYRLGFTVSNVRSANSFLKGNDADERRDWLNSLPNWSWNSSSSTRVRDEASKRTTERMADPAVRQAIVKALTDGRDKAIKRRREEYVSNARDSALPYEPVKKKRQVGKFYYRQDGSIGRCTTQFCLTKVVD